MCKSTFSLFIQYNLEPSYFNLMKSNNVHRFNFQCFEKYQPIPNTRNTILSDFKSYFIVFSLAH